MTTLMQHRTWIGGGVIVAMAIAPAVGVAQPTTAPVPLAGTPIGTAGSYDGAGNTVAKVFDGDLSTYFDAPATAGNPWCGVDLGRPCGLSAVAYAPRPGWAGYQQRMVGGTFQASNSADFSGDVAALFTVKDVPPAGRLTTVPVSGTYRYVRYVGPAASCCNVAEVQVIGTPAGAVTAAAAVAPPGLTVLTGLGSAATTAGTYTVGQAPAVLWVDVRNSTGRDDAVSWAFGDAAPPLPDPRHAVNPVRWPAATWGPSTDLHGRVAAHLYTAAGTYTVTCSVATSAGGTMTATRTVVVQPDSRTARYIAADGNDANSGADPQHPWSPTRFAATAGQPNTVVHCLPGTSLSIASTIRVHNNCWVDLGSATVTTAGVAFDGWPGQTDGAILTGGTATGGGELLVGRGSNVAVANATFGDLNRGVEVDGDGAAGFLVQGCRQSGAVGSQAVSCWGAVDSVAWYGNTITGSRGESPFRTDQPGAAAGFDCEYNDVGQPAGNGKAVMTNRSASDGVVYGNVWRSAPVGASLTIGSTAAGILRVRYEANQFVGDGAYYTLGGGCQGITIVGDDIQSPLTGVHLALPGISDVVVRGLTGPGANYHVYGDGALPGLAIAPAITVK